METTTQMQRPAPTLQPQFSISEEQLNPHGTRTQMDHDAEYDPCENPQKFSPFYMYNHDSPRPSADLRPKESLHISVKDLELGAITPSVTQEKIAAQKKPRSKFNLKFWQGRQECLTKPKKQSWLRRLPKKQRLAVKLLIALLVVSAMVGVAVGIAAALHSGVYGTDDTVGKPT